VSPRTKKTQDDPVRAAVGELEPQLGDTIGNPALLERALVHGSAATEGDLESNETMEFLGDAVLDLAVSEFLMKGHSGRDEGDLTRMRSSIVCAKGLAAAAARLDLGRWIHLGRGEARSGGSRKANILADTYEAIVAAVFLDRGYEAARDLIQRTFAFEIAAADPGSSDWKTELQEITQGRYHLAPSYALVSTSGPDHAKHFVVAIRLSGEEIARGEGPSRKAAEQSAAEVAVRLLKENPDAPLPGAAGPDDDDKAGNGEGGRA
jgi:ribonuclease-3